MRHCVLNAAGTSDIFVVRHEKDTGAVLSISPHALAGPRLNSLGECAESTCSCNRQLFPWVRRRFREMVVAETLRLLAHTGMRSFAYVSLGSGYLLYDFEILAALQEAGAPISSVALVDRGYAH